MTTLPERPYGGSAVIVFALGPNLNIYANAEAGRVLVGNVLGRKRK